MYRTLKELWINENIKFCTSSSYSIASSLSNWVSKCERRHKIAYFVICIQGWNKSIVKVVYSEPQSYIKYSFLKLTKYRKKIDLVNFTETFNISDKYHSIEANEINQEQSATIGDSQIRYSVRLMHIISCMHYKTGYINYTEIFSSYGCQCP